MGMMQYVTLAPDLNVSRICLGTMTFGEKNSFVDACEQLHMARDHGVNFIDCAEMYPVPQRAETQGKSEEYVGNWLRESRIQRDNVVLATKVTGPSGQMTWIRGGPLSLDAKNISEALDGSLKRLQTDYIDIYQLHWPDRYVPMFGETDYNPDHKYAAVPIEEQMEALSRAVAAGKIRHVGVSNETPFGVMEFCQMSNRRPDIPQIISIQNAYNLLCRTFDSGLAECCDHRRVKLLAYSPLAMGLLSGKYLRDDGGPPDARLNLYRGRYAEGESRYNLKKGNVIPAIQEYIEIARQHNISPVALAIGFVLRHPLVASAIVGATKLPQLKEILQSSSVHISAQILEDINKVHEQYPNPCP